LRTEEGRLLVGLAGDRVLALSLVDVWWKYESAVVESADWWKGGDWFFS
jgi:hypothetical protein